ncbi:MAG: low molecular weight phosphotyrosine protein phosphatase [Candidatus Melainabacteria bacterium]|nr:low molecular weight phosphotyrosine protein phosphatase [Candidatus Melainabacteria bacterium]
MAEGILESIYKQSNIAGKVESAGIMDWNVGSRADPRAISVARANGVDLTRHRARQVAVDDFERFDVIFAMDNANAISLHKIAPAHHRHKIRLLGGDQEIADPYHSNEAAFHATYKTIDECCRQAVRELL